MLVSIKARTINPFIPKCLRSYYIFTAVATLTNTETQYVKFINDFFFNFIELLETNVIITINAMVISKRQRLFGKGYTGGSWDAGKNLFLYPGGSLISLCITIVFHALCFNCDVSSQHKAGCSQRWKRNAELCECKVSTVKSQLRPVDVF